MMTSQHIDACTCVYLGSNDRTNLALLKAALRNPGQRLVVGHLCEGETKNFIAYTNDVIGGTFELVAREEDAPRGANVVVLDGREPRRG